MNQAFEALRAACGGQVVPGSVADGVCGVVPSNVARPGSADEVAALLRVAAECELSVVPRGSGSKLDWGQAPKSCDLLLDVSALNRVIDHASGDMVVEVQAGCELGELAATVAAAKQRLPVEVPGYDDDSHRTGTVGGLIASACSGPLRLSFGGIRDLLLGVTMVRADGVSASSGGRVVKNVAGYDLGKLLAGSVGTLGVITSAVLRLHPIPETTTWLTTAVADPVSAVERINALLDEQQSPTTVDIDRTGDGPITIAAGFEGTAGGASSRARLAAAGLWDEATRPGWLGKRPGSPQSTLIEVTVPPASIPEAMDAIAEAGHDLPLRGSAAIGVVYVAVPSSAGQVAPLLRRLREQFANGSVVVVHSQHREHMDMWGPIDVGAAGLMRRVKDQFDPGHRLSPGRFVTGI